MVTAIISRRWEFAMIQSIGMTKRQLRNMLTCEGLYYAGITLVISYILSIFTVGVIVRALTAGGFTTFHFTLLPLVICTPKMLLWQNRMCGSLCVRPAADPASAQIIPKNAP